MAQEFQIKAEGLEEVLAKFKDGFDRRPLRNFVGRVGAYFEKEWKERVSVDTGRYRNSIGFDVKSDTEVIISDGVFYGVFRELGTKPHWPPTQALKRWARRHGMNPFLVARAIARRGTKAEKAIAKSIKGSGASLNKIVKKLGEEIGDSWEK